MYIVYYSKLASQGHVLWQRKLVSYHSRPSQGLEAAHQIDAAALHNILSHSNRVSQMKALWQHRKPVYYGKSMSYSNTHPVSCGHTVTWYSEPSQPQWITPGIKQTSICPLFTMQTSHQTSKSPKTTKSVSTQIYIKKNKHMQTQIL